MSRTELPIAGQTVDLVGLQTALQGIGGEVRFDRLSRALYSTDASVYQIVPLGVVLPRSEEDIVAVMKACGRFGVPLTARGGGTSQAGQCIGPGLVLDCSKYFNRILEINAAERWARVQPGCVLDELNAELKPLGLHFPLDISTSNRATIGGMVANNSSGTRSVVYGKTIDHVLGLRVVLADGSAAEFGPLSEAEWRAKGSQENLEGRCYRVVERLAAEHAAEIEKRFPKILRRVGGYNLDYFGRAGGVSPLFEQSNHLFHQQGACAPRSPRSLSNLLVGSEGTLAVTLEAKLNLVELPRARAVLVIQFHDLLDALGATPAILAHAPSAVEVIDKYVLDSTRQNAEAARLRDFLQGDPGAILLVELSGEELAARLQSLESDLRGRGLGYHWLAATDASAQGRIWKLRKLSLGLSMLEKGDTKAMSFVEDTAVAPERLRDFIAEFLAVIRKHGTQAGVYAHASVGCLHVRPVVNLKTEAGVRQFQGIAEDVADLVLKYGGALSGEHGDGLVRSPFQAKIFGPVLYEAFREIKRTFDPQNILNPGKIVDAPPLVHNLRFGPAYVTPEVPTTFDFSADGGIVRSAELCAGVGECRKKREGSMCPSFQATREEQHSTRGRANVLRLAMTGQLGLAGLTDPAVKEALDLCLECKACKSECPTNVDMARLKAEFLHQYYKKHGVPWRNWIFGNVDRIAGFASPFPRIFNWFGRHRVFRWLNERLLGIDKRRNLPRLHVGDAFDWQLVTNKEYWLPPGVEDKNNLYGIPWYDQWQEAKGFPDDPRPRVLIFPDTFVNIYEPAVGLAAVHILRERNYRVVCPIGEGFKDSLTYPHEQPLGQNCCGRPLISNGMLGRALTCARFNVNSLYPWAAAGKPIIACEPSCILTIKDDYPALLRGEERRKAEVVAAACHTFEEFMEAALSRKRERREEDQTAADESTPSLTLPARTIQFRPGPKKILVQPHCHQRALVGVGPLMNLLRRIPGAEVIDLDAGCCGMAGSFGYEKEHYEISRLVGEQRLFPAIRAAGPDTVIVAPGFSCRLQIEHFTGRKAVHPAELLFSLLDEL